MTKNSFLLMISILSKFRGRSSFLSHRSRKFGHTHSVIEENVPNREEAEKLDIDSLSQASKVGSWKLSSRREVIS